MYKAILFDLDNTLIDFLTFKKETAKAAAKAMIAQSLNANENELCTRIFEIYEQKGIEYQKTFYDVIRPYNLEVGLAEKIQQTAIIAYPKKKFEVLKPYPTVRSTLDKLKKMGLIIGIVTDAPRNKAWQRLILVGLENEFDFVITHEDTKKYKPHPSPFKAALKKLDVEAPGVLFVGDNPGRDIKGATKIGMKTCLAEYGKHIEGTETADFTIKEFDELLDIVQNEV